MIDMFYRHLGTLFDIGLLQESCIFGLLWMAFWLHYFQGDKSMIIVIGSTVAISRTILLISAI